MNHQQRSSYLPVADYQLHLRELVPLKPSAGPVLCLHGAIGNSRIFYTEHGKGLACFLADQGFLVYCADFAGRGLSRPHSAPRSALHSEGRQSHDKSRP